MAGVAPGGASSDDGYRGSVPYLLLPTWLIIGIFLLLPVALMGVYSFLTKEFRGGGEWQFSLAAYDQFFVTRGLFGDEPAQIEWTYINIFWRSIWQAGLATFLCLLIGFPTAWFIATRPEPSSPIWLFLITIPYWVNLLIRTVSLRFILRDQGPMNDALIGNDRGRKVQQYHNHGPSILGDGRNNYLNPRLDSVAEIKSRARKMIWFNNEDPRLWGTGDSDMLEYLPLFDAVHTVANLAQLTEAIDKLFDIYA